MAGDRTVKITILGDDRSGSSALQKLGGVAGEVEAKVSGLGKGLGVLGVAAGTALGGAINAGVGKLASLGASAVKTGFDFNAMYQQADIAFTTMLGSADKSKAFLADLQSFAAATPFEFPQLVSASQKLMAMGFAAKEVVPTLTSIGNAVAGLGGSKEVLDRVTIAFGQMQAKGKASSEEIMQLTEAGIPAWKYLAAAIGTDIPTAMDKVSKGQISASQAIAAFRAGIDKDFGGMMDRQAKSWSGLMSTLADISSQASGRIMAPIFEAMSGGLDKVVTGLSGPGFNAFIASLAAGVGTLVSNLERAFGMIGRAAGQIGTIFATTVAPALDLLGAAFGRTGSESSLAQSKMAGFQRVLDGVVRAVALGARGFQLLVDAIVTVKQAWGGEWFNDSSIVPVIGRLGELTIQARNVWNVISAALAPAFQFLREHMLGVSLAAGPLVSVLMGISPPLALLMGALKLLAVAWMQDWGGIREVTGTVVSAVAGFFTGTLLPALQKLRDMADTNIAAMFAGLDTILPRAAEALASMQVSLQAMNVGNGAGIGGLFAGLAPVLATAESALSTIGGALQGALPALQQLGQALSVGIGGALAVIGPSLQATFGYLQSVLPTLQAALAPLLAQWGPILQQLGDILGVTLVGAVGLLMGVLGGLIGFLEGALPGALQFATGAFQAFTGMMQIAVSGIEGLVNVVKALLAGDWAGAWQAALDALTGMATGANNIFSGLALSILGVVNTLVGGVAGLITGFVDTIIGYFQHLADVLVGHSIIPDMALAIQNTFQSMINAAIGLLTGWVSDVIAKIQGLATDMASAWSAMKSAAESAWEGLKSAVATKIGEVVALVQGLPGRLAGALGDLSGVLVGAGSSLIQGLINGITAKIGELMGVLGGITSKLPDWKGPESVDRRILYPSGRWVMQGFVDGLSDETRAVFDTLRGVTAALPDRAPGIWSDTSPWDQGGAVSAGGTRGRGGASPAIPPATPSIPAPAAAGTAADVVSRLDTIIGIMREYAGKPGAQVNMTAVAENIAGVLLAGLQPAGGRS